MLKIVLVIIMQTKSDYLDSGQAEWKLVPLCQKNMYIQQTLMKNLFKEFQNNPDSDSVS